MDGQNEFDRRYRNVSPEKAEQLRAFRNSHPLKHLAVLDKDWSYTASGHGAETIIVFPGGTRTSEAGFGLITALEKHFRIIGLTYPCVNTLDQLVDGIRAIMDAEGIGPAHCFGSSLGGMIVQCFVRKYPERALTVIAGDTTVPDKELAGKAASNLKAIRWIPMRLMYILGLRRMRSHFASLPDPEREFWLAYVRELYDCHLTKAWLTTVSRCILDFSLNYVFTLHDLDRWPGRVLLIEADDDQAINARQRAALKTMYPQAQVHTFHAAGHMPAITREKEYVTIIETFVRQEHAAGEVHV